MSGDGGTRHSDRSSAPVPSGTTGLDGSHCWSLLRSAEVGRLAVLVEDHPDIFPVNHVVDHGSIVFRTAAGTKLAAAHGRLVAFEVDGRDDVAGTAWSVVVKGRAKKLEEPYGVLDALTLPLSPWHGGHKPWFIRIEPDSITGRRFPIAR